MTRSIGDVFLTVRADLSQFQADLTGLNSEISRSATNLGKSLTNIGRTLSTTGGALTRNLTLPIVAAGAATTNFALDFDTQLRRIVALSDVTADEIGGISDAILAMGPAVGRGPQELAEAFYFVASAGFQAQEAMEVLEVAAKASATGMGTTQDVARVLAGVINAYGHENLSAAVAADQLTAAVQKGSAEASDFAGVIGRVAPGAAALGVSFDQVTAALAGMTNAGLSADESATSLVQIFSSLLKPTTQADAAMESLGLSAAGLRRQLREEGLLDTLRTLEERFANNETASAAVFGNIRALRGITLLLGLDTAQLDAIFASTADSLGSLGNAYDETEGPQRELDRAMADLQATAITLGQDVLPLVVDVVKEIAAGARELGKWWRSLNDDTQKSIIQWLGITAVLGPVLLIVGKLLSAFGALFKVVGLLTGAKGLASLSTRISAVMKVAGRIAPLLLLVDTLLSLPDAFDAIGDAIDGFGRRAPRAMLQAVRRIFEAIPEPFQPPGWEAGLDAMERDLDEFGEDTEQSMFGGWGPRGPIAQRVEDGVDAIATILEDGSVQIGNAAGVMADPIDDAIIEARAKAAEETRKLIEAVATVLSTAPAELKDELDAFFEALGEPFDRTSRLAELEGQAAREEWIAAFTSGDPQAMAAAFQQFSTQILDQLELLLPDVFGAGSVVAPTFMQGIADAVPAAIAALQASGRLGEFTSAFDLADQLDAMGETALAAYVRGMEIERVTSELKAGGIADLTEAFDLADKLDELGDPAGAILVRSLARGLERERTGTLRTNLLRISNDARQAMEFDLSGQGARAIASFANGMYSAAPLAEQAANYVKNKVGGVLEFAASPPYTQIKKIGANVGRFWMEEIVGSVEAGLPQLASMAGSVTSALALAPGFTGAAAYPAQTITAGLTASAPITSTGQLGGIVNNYNLHVSGRLDVDQAQDALDELRRLQTLNLRSGG